MQRHPYASVSQEQCLPSYLFLGRGVSPVNLPAAWSRLALSEFIMKIFFEFLCHALDLLLCAAGTSPTSGKQL
jgi:hypothetical protein